MLALVSFSTLTYQRKFNRSFTIFPVYIITNFKTYDEQYRPYDEITAHNFTVTLTKKVKFFKVNFANNFVITSRPILSKLWINVMCFMHFSTLYGLNELQVRPIGIFNLSQKDQKCKLFS